MVLIFFFLFIVLQLKFGDDQYLEISENKPVSPASPDHQYCSSTTLGDSMFSLVEVSFDFSSYFDESTRDRKAKKIMSRFITFFFFFWSLRKNVLLSHRQYFAQRLHSISG